MKSIYTTKREFGVMTTYQHKMLNIIKFLIISLFIAVGTSQTLELFMQKTTLENSLRDKVYSEVGHIIDKTKFVVIVNLELDNGSLGNELQTNQLQDLSKSPISDISAKAPSPDNSMEFIPGFQLSGSNVDTPSNQSNTVPPGEDQGLFGKFGSLKIKKIGVNFFLEESIASPTLSLIHI